MGKIRKGARMVTPEKGAGLEKRAREGGRATGLGWETHVGPREAGGAAFWSLLLPSGSRDWKTVRYIGGAACRLKKVGTV